MSEQNTTIILANWLRILHLLDFTSDVLELIIQFTNNTYKHFFTGSKSTLKLFKCEINIINPQYPVFLHIEQTPINEPEKLYLAHFDKINFRPNHPTQFLVRFAKEFYLWDTEINDHIHEFSPNTASNCFLDENRVAIWLKKLGATSIQIYDISTEKILSDTPVPVTGRGWPVKIGRISENSMYLLFKYQNAIFVYQDGEFVEIDLPELPPDENYESRYPPSIEITNLFVLGKKFILVIKQSYHMYFGNTGFWHHSRAFLKELDFETREWRDVPKKKFDESDQKNELNHLGYLRVLGNELVAFSSKEMDEGTEVWIWRDEVGEWELFGNSVFGEVESAELCGKIVELV